MGKARNTNGVQKEHMLLVEKPEGKSPLGRPRRKLVHRIEMDLGETGCDGVIGIGLAQDRDQRRPLVNAVLNYRVPQNAGSSVDRRFQTE
jgi:hypothetical protein